jgi:ABC-type bacteriocin/lantibiotic exporter with double-glycine peptidase domain
MFAYEAEMSKYIAIVYLVYSILFYRVLKKQRVLSERILESETKVFNDTSLLIDAIPQLRSSATEFFFLSKWADKLRSQTNVNNERQALSDSVQILSTLSYQITMVIILTLVAYDFHQYTNVQNYSSITGLFPIQFSSAGTFLAFIVAFTSFDSYYSLFMNSITTNVILSISQWKRSSPLLYQSPEQGYRPHLASHIPSGNIKLQGVSYSINDMKILDNINLEIKQGEQVGITGPSGSGKSTFIRLISGVILANSGKVLIDGMPIEELNLKTLRSSIGIVTQVSIIPSTSIKEFLAPSFSYSDEEVWEALSTACIADEIMAMPMRLQTILSEGATNISGGQRQRLLIAKALIKSPSILLLDEATSALPESTQSKIIENIQKLKVTSLSIAHRLDTIQKCDQIHFFKNGKIIESGTFDSMKIINDYTNT